MIIQNDYTDSMADVVKNIDSVEIFTEGKVEFIDNKNLKLNIIKDKIYNLFIDARIMPAFGVSLHNEALNAMQQDCWIKLNFNNLQYKNGLPFSSLLLKIEKCYGTNLIRLYNNKYEGRCIYLDFMEQKDLFDLIKFNI